ncbi:hypothetical protein SynWH8101_0789 [Synechococcus sp. WH 8101]|nr:hypothetical protein SynWH8101_0789 [Synechococcus sp. WH 8101]
MTTCPTPPSAHFLVHKPVALPIMPDLDQQIAQAHHDLEAVEMEAKKLEARLRRIPGMERLLPNRNYGRPVNIEAIKGNLTARGLVNSYDEPLASYLGINSGSARIAEERAEARKMAAEAMRLRVERLQQQNAAAQQQRERYAIAGVNPVNGRRLGS